MLGKNMPSFSLFHLCHTRLLVPYASGHRSLVLSFIGACAVDSHGCFVVLFVLADRYLHRKQRGRHLFSLAWIEGRVCGVVLDFTHGCSTMGSGMSRIEPLD